ncbi:MAG: efflux RND transporter periplasmic adaptor subunit, partial [Francisellaceae bacterium]|nr:efflux RND transporter periplasmic adaptor subunit [Francisellaceae bacterium]
MMKKICIKYVIFILIGFILGVVTQKLYQTSFKSNTTEKKIIYWVAPMDPNYRKDKAGKSPMGMDLIPVYEGDEANTTDTSIMISPTIEHNLGVRTAKVEKQEIFRMIDTVGSITVDENQIEHTHVYAEGWIKELLVKVEGEHVKKGQLLFKIYSPKIVTAQDEYLLALQNKNIALKGAATKKLQSLGFSTKQFKDLEYTKKSNELTDIYAEQDGV